MFFKNLSLFAPVIPRQTTFRSIISITALKNSYQVMNHHNKHLSPLYGAMMAYTGTLERLYDINAVTATSQLVRNLFYKRGPYSQFKETELKTNPAYSLTPVLLAHIIHHLTEGTLSAEQTKEKIYQLWRKQHYQLTGEKKISKVRVTQFIDWMVTSQNECLNNHYLTHTTEYILLGYLHFKSKQIDDINNYLITLNQLRGVLNKKNNKTLTLTQLTDHQSVSIQENYENIVLTTMLSGNRLKEVLETKYGYLDRKPKTNCFESAMHNLLNILLYNTYDNKFDFNLLPKTLKPCHAMITLYHDISPSDINLREVGQAFMNMVSGHQELQYCADQYELDTVSSNFTKLLNLLFNISASSLDELSKQFSDKRRQIQFMPDPFGIRINVQSAGAEAENHLFYLDTDHAELRTPYFKQQLQQKPVNTQDFQQIIHLASSDPGKHFMLLSVLHKTGYYANMVELIKDDSLAPFVYFLFPKTNSEAYELAKKIPSIHSIKLKNFKDYLFYLATQYDDYHTRHFVFNLFIKHHFDRDDLKIQDFCLSYDAYYYLVEKLKALEEDGSFSNTEMLGLIKKTKETDLNVMLKRAIKDNQLRLARLLLMAGANPNPPGIDDLYFKPPLFEALISIYTHVQMIKLLIEAGADLNTTNMGKPPLHFLLHFIKYKTNHVDVYYEAIKLLLEHGARLDEKDDKGLTPIEITELFVDVKIQQIVRDILNEHSNEVRLYPRYR